MTSPDQVDLNASQKAVGVLVQDEFGVRIPATTAERVLAEEEIIRRDPPTKIELLPEKKVARIVFAQWALGKLQLGCIFIFSDEMTIDRDRHRKARKQSRRKGSNRFDSAARPPTTFKSVLCWGAIARGQSPGPFFVWWPESEAERRELSYILDTKNQENEQAIIQNRQLARIPGTEQHQALQDTNANVQQQDREDPLPSGRPRRLRLPEWEWKFEVATRDLQNTKGGIDWARYRESVLRPRLYPWAKQIAERTGRTVWVIVDNATPHTKTRRFAVNERQQMGITVADFSAKSPDLNKIERIWDPFKDEFEQIRARTPRQKLTPIVIEDRMYEIWHKIDRSKVDRECANFEQKLHQVLENDGDNKFFGWPL